MMGRAGSLTLIVSSIFLAVVALILNSPGLFYMGTALIALFAAAKLQAYLAVRGLIVERILPDTAQIGETVTIIVNVASTKAIQRPLVFLKDMLPRHMKAIEVRPALPIAPAFGKFIVSSYQIKPMRRGIYNWDSTEVTSTDALGLTSSRAVIISAASTLKVYPAPIKVPLPTVYSTGSDESGTGLRQAVSGLQIRSVRDYVNSDPLKNIHWKSTAKTGKLMVKEFEIETSQACQLILQHSAKCESPKFSSSSLDLVCGMALYVARNLIEDQVSFTINQLNPAKTKSSETFASKELAVENFLVEIEANSSGGTRQYFDLNSDSKPSMRFLFLVASEPELLAEIQSSGVHTVAYVLGKCTAINHMVEQDCAYNSDFLSQLNRLGVQTVVIQAGESA